MNHVNPKGLGYGTQNGKQYQLQDGRIQQHAQDKQYDVDKNKEGNLRGGK